LIILLYGDILTSDLKWHGPIAGEFRLVLFFTSLIIFNLTLWRWFIGGEFCVPVISRDTLLTR
jgi:hypothetical protein